MQLGLRGRGDAQADCARVKMLDPVPGAVPTCTPDEVASYITWKASIDADIARHATADATNPATIMIGLVTWASPSFQFDMLFNRQPHPPLLYYIGAALPFVALFFIRVELWISRAAKSIRARSIQRRATTSKLRLEWN